MILHHNITAMNVMRQLGITNTNLNKTTEKLSSGYRINHASDDTANLQISEKKRAQIRGLVRAARNADDGISFVQTGDSAMDEMESILHRMRELCIQSSNDTYTDEDRATMQMEFDQLQSEIDKINDQTEFNTLKVFEHYPDTYFSFNGNRLWSQDQIHNIDNSNHSLAIKYQLEKTGPEKEITLTIPNGTYTTQELIDEMDTIITTLGDKADGLYLEYTKSGCCNMVLQNGETISELSGGLSYLFFDEFTGSQMGSLIGTTIFDPDFPLVINERNNELKFTIEKYDGTTSKVDITIASGLYTRQDMINYLNQKLAGTGMEASGYGDYSIQIGGEEGVITGLKGNMFQIDEAGQVMVSVFYDNTKYGSVQKTPGQFTGGAVLVNNASDITYNHFHMDGSNNTLRIRVNADAATPYTDITLDYGDYTMAEMLTQLQNKLTAAGLDVTVESHAQNYTTPNRNTLSFSGLKIISNQKGQASKIEFDIPGSSAYRTLFVERKYTDRGSNVSSSSGYYRYTAPALTGGKTFQSADFPLTIDNTNKSFKLSLTEKLPSGTGTTTVTTPYTVTLAEKTYLSLSEIITEINKQLNGAGTPVGMKGKIEAVNSAEKIQFKPTSDNHTITRISFMDTTTIPYSSGYDTLFIGKTVTYTTTPVSSSSTAPSITLDKIDDPAVFDETNNKLSITVDGTTRPVVIPPGTYTHDQLIEELNKQLKGTTLTYPNTYSASGRGETTDRSRNLYSSGSVNRLGSISCNQTGSGGTLDGTTTVYDPKPATYTVPVALKPLIPVNADNDQFTITINDHPYTIALDHRTYTPADLASALNNQLDSVITSGSDKATVSLEDGKLKFTTKMMGSQVKMSFDASTSTLMDSISKEKTPATINTGLALQESVTIDSNSNIFSGTANGKSYSVTLTNGTYTRNGFIQELNKQLAASAAGVTVSLSGANLTLSTTEANGYDSALTFDTNHCGTAAHTMFGELVSDTPATAVLQTPLKNPSVIKDGENVFKVRITEGATETDLAVTIPAGTYTNRQMADKLNELFGGKVSVALNNSGSLTFTTNEKGSNISIAVNNSIGGSAGNAMFGETTVTTPDITASFAPDGKLVLSGSQSSSRYTISVRPATGSSFLKPVETIKKTSPSSVTGNLSMAYYKLNSHSPLPASLNIADYNKELRFLYHTPAGQTVVEITLDEKENYTCQELQTTLQNKIDAILGNDSLTVSVSSSGISLQAKSYGNDYTITDLSGGFYEYVMKGTAERQLNMTPSKSDGTQNVSDTYIIGRKDVRNNTSSIKKEVNDRLGIDVTIDNTVYSLNITITPGNYDYQSLIKELQDRIDEEVLAQGLPAHSVLVGVGMFDSGVVGANDLNSLDIYLNKDADLQPGSYKIDGLNGSSLFEIFYKTTGDPVPAYINGTKDISNGVVIEPGKNEFSLDVDGVTYSYTLPEGEYTTEEFIQKLNELFDSPDNNGNTALLESSLSGDSLKITYKKLGKHEINNAQGSAKPAIFYETEGRTDYSSQLFLQVGANTNQLIDLHRFSMSTLSLGINSITVSKQKYAQKAFGRLDTALDYLNSRRSEYGAKQNRLEHTIRGNDNTSENLQSSESQNRDTDMAKEMVSHSRQQILQQAGMAILAHANQNTSSFLSLLQK